MHVGALCEPKNVEAISKIETRAQRIVTMTVTEWPAREISSFSQPCGDLSKDNGIARCGNVPFGTPY
jgi:hypothetical protein